MDHTDTSSPTRQPHSGDVPEGRVSFDLTLGPLRLRLVDLPTTRAPFVEERYGAFAEPVLEGREADLTVQCRVEDRGVLVPLPPPGEITVLRVEREAEARFTLRSHWHEATIDLGTGRGTLLITERNWDLFGMSVENFVRVAFQLLAIEHGAFLMHTAAVLDEGRCVFFFGPSGAGKSTATAFSEPRPALSDDMVLVDVTGSEPRATTVPFFMVYPPEQRLRGAHPVAAALRLRQSRSDSLERLDGARAIATVSASVPYVHELGLPHHGLTELVARFCQTVPVAELEFTKSAAFWDVIRPLL